MPRAVPELLRLFAPRESMEVNPFDEAIVDEGDLFALDDETLEAIHSADAGVGREAAVGSSVWRRVGASVS